MRLLRVIVFLLIACFAGLAGYAYFGDMAADPQQMRVPVELDLGQPAAPALPEAGNDPTTPAEPAPAATPDGGTDGGSDAALD